MRSLSRLPQSSLHQRSSRVLHAVAALVAGTLVAMAAPAAARADLVSPDQTICNGKILGDACTLTEGGAGTCQSRDCSRTVVGADGGTTKVQRTCVTCVGGPSADSGVDQGGEVKGGGCSVGASASNLGLGALALFAAGIVLGARRKRN